MNVAKCESTSIKEQNILQLQNQVNLLRAEQARYSQTSFSLHQLENLLQGVHIQRSKQDEDFRRQASLNKENILNLTSELESLRLAHRQKLIANSDLRAEEESLALIIREWDSESEVGLTRCRGIANEKYELEREQQMLEQTLQSHVVAKGPLLAKLQELQASKASLDCRISQALDGQNQLHEHLGQGLAQKQQLQRMRRELHCRLQVCAADLQELQVHCEEGQSVLKEMSRDIAELESRVRKVSLENKLFLDSLGVDETKQEELKAQLQNLSRMLMLYEKEVRALSQENDHHSHCNADMVRENTGLSEQLLLAREHLGSLGECNSRLQAALYKLREEDEAVGRLLQKRAGGR